MSTVEDIARAAGVETDGGPGGQLIRCRDVNPFLDAAAAAGVGILGFDIFRPGPQGLELDVRGTASFKQASVADNNIELSRSILASHAEDDEAWVDFTFD